MTHPLSITELLDWLDARIADKQWDALHGELSAHVDAIRKAYILVQNENTALTAALVRLVKTYDGLFANSPTGNAALFESALAEARAALDAARRTP